MLAAWIDARWIAVLRGVAVAAVLAFFWRSYTELHRKRPHKASATDWLLAVGVGIAVFFVWIAFDEGWAVVGEPGGGFVPLDREGRVDWVLAGPRLLGLALVVPLMEELFWRSFLMRWIAKRDFLALDPRAAGWGAFAISSALFAVEHSMWFAGLLAGAAYGGLYMRSRDLWIPIASHTTTNAILGIWILSTRQWHLW